MKPQEALFHQILSTFSKSLLVSDLYELNHYTKVGDT